MSLGVMARYNSVVVELEVSNKLGSPLNKRVKIKFIGFFEGTDDLFIAKYKPSYPNHTFQIFKHNKKPLLKEWRTLIENSTEVKQKLRDYNLSKLID